jgi:hypothetical protein
MVSTESYSSVTYPSNSHHHITWEAARVTHPARILVITKGGGRMTDWLRPADCEVLTIRLRGINYQFAHLVLKRRSYSTLCWFQSRPRFYMAPASADIWGKMAEWLRPADCEVLTIKLRGINYQAAHLVPKKKTI